MYVGYWEKQVCLRDALIDDLVKQVAIYKEIADAEIRMSEVMRQELLAAIERLEEERLEWENQYNREG